MHLLEATPIDYERYGFVAEVTKVNTDYIKQLLEAGIIPIISPIAIDHDRNDTM